MNVKKQEYAAPRLVEYGRIEDITRGYWGGTLDGIIGLNNGDGGLGWLEDRWRDNHNNSS